MDIQPISFLNLKSYIDKNIINIQLCISQYIYIYIYIYMIYIYIYAHESSFIELIKYIFMKRVYSKYPMKTI